MGAGVFIGLCCALLVMFASSGVSLSTPLRQAHAGPPWLPIAPSQIDDIEIVTAHYREDLNWLNVSRVPVIICDKPGSSPLPPGRIPDYMCSVHLNVGNEASSFLAYIVSRYDSLPTRVAFLHGHEFSHHQKAPFDSILRSLQSARPEMGYVPLNVFWHVLVDAPDQFPPGSPEEVLPKLKTPYWHWNYTKEVWPVMLEPVLHRPRPRYIRNDRGAQFVVRRELIQKYPKKDWEHLLSCVMKLIGPPKWSRIGVGMAMEIAWPMLFQESNDICDLLPECTLEAARDTYFDLHKNFTHIIKTPREIEKDNRKIRLETESEVLFKDGNQSPKDGPGKAATSRRELAHG